MVFVTGKGTTIGIAAMHHLFTKAGKDKKQSEQISHI